MYTEYFGFREKPFNIVPNPAYLYPSSKHKMALTYLEYGLSEGVGFILLTGEVGTGKTTLIRYLLRKIQPIMNVAVIFNTNISSENLLRLILQEFEVEPAGDDKAQNIERLNLHLIERYSRKERNLLIIDEAQNLSHESLEEIRMLSNLQTETDSLLQICLVGQPELKNRMQHPSLQQLAQRILVNYHLGPLSEQETTEYVRYRLKSAGGKNLDLFPGQVISRIYQESEGIPRIINILCDAALVYAYADEAKTVSPEMIEQVIQDRRIEDPEAEGGIKEKRGGKSEPSLHTEDLSERINALESRVSKLSIHVDWYISEMQKQFDSNKDNLIKKLEELLEKERKVNRRLVVQCSKLQNELESTSAEPAEALQQEPLVLEEEHMPEKKVLNTRSLLRWLIFLCLQV